MTVFVFTKKEGALRAVFKRGEFLNMAALAKHKPGAGDMSYLDISGMDPAEIKKAAAQMRKKCSGSQWGIIDPKGGAADPARFFFDGASDYIGSGALKSLDAKRLNAAAEWRLTFGGGGGDAAEAGSGAEGLPKTGIKVPPGKFPGWKSLPSGKTMPFYLLYCGIQGKSALTNRISETVYAQMHQRLSMFLHMSFQDAEGLLWMDTGKDFLLLLPPKTNNAAAAVKICMRLLISAPMICMETLGLRVPANFIFALHYGAISYRPPGKTGTVVSDAVNSVFHLGAKKAELGRLSITGELPDNSVPQSLEDCFVPAGTYEGRAIWHSKRFTYNQSWT
jgi:hypothetical protein